MTPSGSTSRIRSSGCGLVGESLRAAVEFGVVGRVVLPAAPEHADPGAGQDTGGVMVVLAGGAGAVVDVGGPRAGEAAGGGEGGQCDAEAFVAGPAEGHAALPARGLGDRGDSGQGGDGVGVVEDLAGLAPFGQDLGGVDGSGAGQ